VARQRAAQIADSVMAENLRRLHAAGATIAVGTDAGNPLTLHGASILDELAAMERAGIHAESLLVMATRNGARAMRRTDFGTLSAGMSADLTVLGADPGQGMASSLASLQRVMLKGNWVKGQ
jgi:imidazolonepropionase-like amidohydrolase